MCVKLGNGPGVGPGPQAAQNLQMPRSIPVGGGGRWVQLELADAYSLVETLSQSM